MADESTPSTEDVRNWFAYGSGPQHTWDESRQDFDRWLAAHDAEKDARIAALEARLAAHQRLGLAAIFLADTFDGDTDPDVEIRRIRDEWLAERDAADAIERLARKHPEPEWEYGVRFSSDNLLGPCDLPFSTLEAAVRDARADLGDVILRRRPASKWEPFSSSAENGPVLDAVEARREQVMRGRMVWKDKRIAVRDVKEGTRMDAGGVRDGWDATTDDAIASRMFYPSDMFAFEPDHTNGGL